MSKFSVVPQKEDCAVWTISPDKITGGILEVDAAKSVRLIKQWEKPRGLPGQVGKIGKELIEHLRNVPLILSLDSSLAYTSITPFRLNLEGDARKDRLEFHGILRELVNRANLETRLLAARALGVEDLDSVLFDARVMGLKMDGKGIAGWPQIGGKKLEGTLHATFTTRPVFHELQEVLQTRKEIFVTEEGKAALLVLERQAKSPFRLFTAEPGRTEYVVLDYRHEPIIRKTALNWESPLALLREEWNLSESAARQILQMRKAGEVSTGTDRILGRMFDYSEDSFRKIMNRLKFRGPAFIRGADVLPFELPFLHEGAEVRAYPLREIWESLGFAGEPEPAAEPMLLPFLEFHYYRGDPAHHRALARQIHWIAP